MFSIVISFLKSHWQTALIVSGALSVAATISLQHFELAHARRELALCHAENRTLENSNKALLASIEDQNRAIEALKADAERKKAVSEKALAAAQGRAQAYAKAAADLAARGASKDECADLRGLVNGFVKAGSKS